MKNVSEPSFWETAYKENRDGWELGAAAPPIVRALADIPVREIALVLGVGRGHEARTAAQLGWRVVGIDFVPFALEEAKRLTSEALAQRIEWRTQDLFDLAKTPDTCDLVIEHTTFCAIDPKRREEWARAVFTALRPGGLLLGLFYTHARPDGPPFGATHADVLATLERAGFRIERQEVPADSITKRQTEELLVHARKP